MHITTMVRTDKVAKDNTAPVIFYVAQQKIATGEKCDPAKWNSIKQAMKSSHNGADLLNGRLEKKRIALRSIIESRSGDLEAAKAAFKRYLENPKELDKILSKTQISESQAGASFHLLVDDILNEHRSHWSDKYILKFKTIRKKILDYDPHFKIENTTASWWREFANHCAEDKNAGGLGNSSNTISTDAKVLSTVIDLLRDRGVQFAPGLDAIGQAYREPEIMSLEWDQVKAIADVDLSDPQRLAMKDSRILWLIGAYTGRRWSEVAAMTPANFYQDQQKRWRYKGSGWKFRLT